MVSRRQAAQLPGSGVEGSRSILGETVIQLCTLVVPDVANDGIFEGGDRC